MLCTPAAWRRRRLCLPPTGYAHTRQATDFTCRHLGCHRKYYGHRNALTSHWICSYQGRNGYRSAIDVVMSLLNINQSHFYKRRTSGSWLRTSSAASFKEKACLLQHDCSLTWKQVRSTPLVVVCWATCDLPSSAAALQATIFSLKTV